MKRRVTQIAPSILSADFANLAADIKKVERAGCDMIHIDVMDGHFVPNITVGPVVVGAIRRVTRLPLDTHLMIEDPERYLESFVKAGSDSLTIHAETCGRKTAALLKKIRALGVRSGVSINPATPLSKIDDYLAASDLVLLMTVNPGFGGQAFMRDVLPKIAKLRARFNGDIQVDGGINKDTAPEAVAAGANILVAGTAIFGSSDVTQAIKELRCQK